MYGSAIVEGMGVRVGVGVVIRGPGETILLEKRPWLWRSRISSVCTQPSVAAS